MVVTANQVRQLRGMGFPQSMISNVEQGLIVSPVDFRLAYTVAGTNFPADPTADSPTQMLAKIRAGNVTDPVEDILFQEGTLPQETGQMNGDDLLVIPFPNASGGIGLVDIFSQAGDNGPGFGTTIVLEDGADLRDSVSAGSVGSLAVPGVVSLARFASRVAPGAAKTSLGGLMAVFGSGVRVAWNRLPGWAQTILTFGGVAVGTEILMDFPGVPGEGAFGNGSSNGFGQFGPGVQTVGSWVANGVTFYRLSDGKLAVQNKRGRWKVWRPKKPIVLMPTGAGDLRTLLRADAVLNKQSKRIAAMLNRRASRTPRKPRAALPGAIVVAQDGSKVTQI